MDENSLQKEKSSLFFGNSNDKYQHLNLNQNSQKSQPTLPVQSSEVKKRLGDDDKASLLADNQRKAKKDWRVTHGKWDSKERADLKKLDNLSSVSKEKDDEMDELNRSTLSLHIAAFEKSPTVFEKAVKSVAKELSSSKLRSMNALEKALFAPSWNGVRSFLGSSTSTSKPVLRDTFNVPEVMLYKATQKLLNPNGLEFQGDTNAAVYDIPDEYLQHEQFDELVYAAKVAVAEFCARNGDDAKEFKAVMDQRIQEMEIYNELEKAGCCCSVCCCTNQLQKFEYPRVRRAARQSLLSTLSLHSQRYGLESIKVTAYPGDNERCYRWSRVNKLRNNIQDYTCTACRSIYDKSSPAERQPKPILKFDTQSQEWKSLEPSNPHYCGGILKNEARGTEMKRRAINDARETRKKPKLATVDMDVGIAERYALNPQEDRNEIRNFAFKNKDTFGQAIRRAKNSLFPNVTSIDQLDNQECDTLKLTIMGELTGDREQVHILWKDDRNVIMGSKYFLEILKIADEIFCDGTFAFRPAGTRQIYRMFGLIDETVNVPCITILMSGQTEEDYLTVFNAVSELLNDEPIDANFAHFDHEVAAVKAFRESPSFIGVIAKMCTFHVRQRLHAQVVDNGLKLYYNNPDYSSLKHFITRIGGLQIIPLNLVNESMMVLHNYLETNLNNLFYTVKLRAILRYYQNTWVGTSLGRMFFTAGDLETNRTNNYAESYNAHQEQYFSTKQGTLGGFLYENRRLQHSEEQNVRSMLNGDQPKPLKKDGADGKIVEKRNAMIEALDATVDPQERSQIIFRSLFSLGRLAGMAAEL